jgi:ribose 5-phosphate isomerase B
MEPTPIVLAADHAGYELKEIMKRLVSSLGYQAIDAGTCHPELPDDYPDWAEALADRIRSGEAKRGILICGSGVGVCVAANKIPGIRAAICHDSYSARQGVEHDNMNVLVLGARIIGSELASDLVRDFLGAAFSNEDRHVRRLAKVHAIEEKYCGDGH